jgi:hypothetical protein
MLFYTLYAYGIDLEEPCLGEYTKKITTMHCMILCIWGYPIVIVVFKKFPILVI